MRTRVRLARAGGALLVAASLTSCLQVPRSGPVVEAPERVEAPLSGAPYNNPRPPQPGASPADIVTGFLDAMTATPLRTIVARQFLTQHGQDVWNPEQGVVTYSRHSRPHGTSNVTIRLHGADRIGAGGQWLGRPEVDGVDRLSFPMRREDGEWRIAETPNALLLPRTFYEQAFQDVVLYLFDPSGRILIPELVHMPQGPQLATSLIRAMLKAPRPALVGVARSFLPPGLTVAPVVVSAKRVADVSLEGTDPGELSRKATRLMLAQLSWTLRQDPSIKGFQLTIAGRPITDATGSSTFRVYDPAAVQAVGQNAVARYDPAVESASSQTYALRRGLLVSGPANHTTRVDGAFGTHPQGIGTFAVSLHDDQVAATTPTRLLVGPVRGAQAPQDVLSGPGLLRPAWDHAGRVWEVQNGPGGAVVSYVRSGHDHPVRVPGVTGRDVRRFLVSRDGSRLVVVVHRPQHDRIAVSRIRYDGQGRALGATQARPVPWLAGQSNRVRDIGWTSPTTIAVLDQLNAVQAEVRILNVDGSTSATETPAIAVPGRAFRLATSPVGAQTPYAVQQDRLFDLAQVDTTDSVPIAHLRYLTYAG